MGCAARVVVRSALLVLLLCLIPTGYLIFEYYLKPWGRDRVRDYANAATAASADLSGALVDGVACVRCVGINNVFPVTATTHPTYGGFQKMLINDGGWITASLLTIGVAIGAGGSLVLSLLHVVTSSSSAASLKPTSSTAHNGCGLFEMVLMISQAQFITLLGMLELNGVPRFFLEFSKKLAWTNLQIFPPETSFKPEAVSMVSGSARRLAEGTNATGVPRYAALIGAKPEHFFYYTCAALAIALASIAVVYLALRVLLTMCRKPAAAATLDHRVIWVFLLVLMLAQYIVSTASCFQIYDVLNQPHRATGDVVLPLVLLTAACVGFVVFAIIKLARHRDALHAHGSPSHDPTQWFHLRYSVFYQDYTLENLYFFVAKLVLDIASGAIVGTIQDGPLQIAILVAFNGAFLGVLIWRQPFLVPLFYYVAVLAGYLRIVLLLLALVQAKSDIFSQDVRDYCSALIVAINIVLLLCLLVRMFYVLCVAIFRWASRTKTPAPADEEMGIPLQELRPTASHKRSSMSATEPPTATSTKTSSSKSRRSQNATTQPIADSTLFSSQPYHALHDEDRAARPNKRRSTNDRHSLPGYATATSTDGSTTSAPAKKGGGRRSLYTRRARQHRDMMSGQQDIPDWAKV